MVSMCFIDNLLIFFWSMFFFDSLFWKDQDVGNPQSRDVQNESSMFIVMANINANIYIW